tara:strand:- start:4 stop:561 length:558 start_codon:yes stop_codon:yes gene_type:complete
MSRQKMYIPTFISNQDFESAKVRPRVFFFGGKVETTPFYIGGKKFPPGSTSSYVLEDQFPSFDHFTTGSYASTQTFNRFPDSGSHSTLFFNENPAYGTSPPTGSLYSEYWDQYVALLYEPKTRLIECSAVLPFADYVQLELNDIIVWRGNHYHLRAINKYNLKNGECELELLGPILADALDNQFS